jgi:tetratricopeptide (TPR) repeat protein
VRVLGALAVGRHYHPDARLRDDLSADALAMARRLEDPRLLGEALIARVLAMIGVQEHFDEVGRLIAEALLLPNGASDALGYEVLAHYLAVLINLSRGETLAAEASLEHGLALSEELGLRVPRVQLQWVHVVLTQWRGDHTGAEALIEATHREHEQTELFYSDGSRAQLLLWLRWEQGRVHEEPAAMAVMSRLGLSAVWEATALIERDRLEEAREVLEAPGALRPEPRSWAWLGNTTFAAHLVADTGAVLHLGRLRAELTPYADLVAAVSGLGMAGPVSLALGRLAAMAGDDAEARQLYDGALQLVDRAASPTWATRTRLHLGELLLRSDVTAAVRLLEQVVAEAERLGLARVAARAAALIAPARPGGSAEPGPPADERVEPAGL